MLVSDLVPGLLPDLCYVNEFNVMTVTKGACVGFRMAAFVWEKNLLNGVVRVKPFCSCYFFKFKLAFML